MVDAKWFVRGLVRVSSIVLLWWRMISKWLVVKKIRWLRMVRIALPTHPPHVCRGACPCQWWNMLWTSKVYLLPTTIIVPLHPFITERLENTHRCLPGSCFYLRCAAVHALSVWQYRRYRVFHPCSLSVASCSLCNAKWIGFCCK